MKNLIRIVFSHLLIGTFILFAAATVNAQNAPQLDSELRNQASDKQPKRASLLQQLDLTPEQIQKIRAINRETRQEIRLAGQRQRQARRALDQAIYSQTANQGEVEQRTREFVEAQSQATALRAKLEFRIRQVLTDEQLVAFVELRRQAAQNLLRRNSRPPVSPDERTKRFSPRRPF